jgi:type 1 fimbria pilin
MRKKVTAVLLAGAFALSIPAAAAADNPHAGNSGHFQGSATPCKSSTNNPNCPPFGS